MKLSDNLEKFKNKISADKKRNEEDLFKLADEVMGVEDEKHLVDSDSKLVRKSYTIPLKELKHIEKIKEKALKKMIVWNDSEILRISLALASELPFIALEEVFSKLERVRIGRPIKRKYKRKSKFLQEQ
jgi:hypothetical protein